MYQDRNDISCLRYRTELDMKGINQLIDTDKHDNDILRIYIILRFSYL
jgi:hypothetical protein